MTINPFEFKRPDSKKQDAESEAILYAGASISQLARLFKMDNRSVKAAISGKVQPVGKRAGHEIYSIRESAPYLVKPAYDMDQFIARMQVVDMPEMVRREMWMAKLAQQKYELAEGKLWTTESVAEAFADAFKTLRMQMLLIRESIERESELTEEQRNVTIQHIDSAMEELRNAIVNKFKQHARETESQNQQGFESLTEDTFLLSTEEGEDRFGGV